MSDREQGQAGGAGGAGGAGRQGGAGGVGGVGGVGGAGGAGQQGIQGDPGIPGPKGEKGTTPLVIRYATAAYLILALGVCLALYVSTSSGQRNDRRSEERFQRLCETGNDRSELQIKVFEESRARIKAFDFRSIINLPEPARSERADQLRDEALKASDANIKSVPFLDCKTATPVPRPEPSG